MKIAFFFVFISAVNNVRAWDSEQLEVFDVVEEVKQNFYELLAVSKDASSQEIRSAFRTLSLKLHPDKNLDRDTSEDFRNLVSVYDILKSPAKRKHYDDVLVNGMPNWKSAMYYYRYVRKMGMTEVIIILFFIITIGQYLVNWAAYAEKIFTIQENLKRLKKPGRKGQQQEEPVIEIPRPSFKDTLPIQIPKLIWYLIASTPTAIILLKTLVAEKIEEATRPPPMPEPEYEPPPKIKTVRKRNKFVVPEGPNFEMPIGNVNTADGDSEVPSVPIVSGGLWTDDDLDELIRLVKKYPQGSAGRWEVIAEALGRSVPEVTFMAHKMKQNGYRIPSEQVDEIVQPKIKQKTKKENDFSGEGVQNWSQVQQRALEDGLAKYSKGVAERWDRIAECVPEKTKEECLLRFKYLADVVKKQKQSVMTNSETISETTQ